MGLLNSLCEQEERNCPSSASQGLSKGEPRHCHAVFSVHLCSYKRREMAHPVPAKVFLKVSPDMAMLFSQSVCVHRRQTAHPVPAKVFLKVNRDMTMLL